MEWESLKRTTHRHRVVVRGLRLELRSLFGCYLFLAPIHLQVCGGYECYWTRRLSLLSRCASQKEQENLGLISSLNRKQTPDYDWMERRRYNLQSDGSYVRFCRKTPECNTAACLLHDSGRYVAFMRMWKERKRNTQDETV